MRSRHPSRTMGIGVLLAVVLWGCTQATKDRLMHFFFEIPDEQAPAEELSNGATAPRPDIRHPEVFEKPPERFASVHPAVTQRQCARCHAAEDKMQVDEQLLMSSCRNCHPRYFSDEVRHIPVADGECRSCHTLHRSRQPSLLLLPVFDTCVDCHDEPEELSEESHSREGVEDCIRCHDPHFGSEMLLRPGYSTQ